MNPLVASVAARDDIPFAEVTQVRRELNSARDSQIARVVAMVDALPARGVADNLIALLRPRLAQLRPDRPLQFERLLFLPFDPVIVAPQDWSPGSPTVPRTLLTPVSAIVRQALGDVATNIEAEIAGRTTADRRIIEEVGAQLWPAAARVIGAVADTPGEGFRRDLPGRLQDVSLSAIAAGLEQAVIIQAMVASAGRGEPVAALALMPILDRANCHGAEAWGMVLALLLCRLPRADEVLRLIAANATKGATTATRIAADQVIDTVLSGLERDGVATAALGTIDLGAAGAELSRIIGLLDGLEADAADSHGISGGQRGERQNRIAGIRRRLDGTCRSRFEAGLAGELMLPMLSLAHNAGSAEILKLEDTARDLRRLELCGRRLGNPDGYSRMLSATASEIRTMNSNPGLTLADRVRMVEILAGPDEALAMLAAEQGEWALPPLIPRQGANP